MKKKSKKALKILLTVLFLTGISLLIVFLIHKYKAIKDEVSKKEKAIAATKRYIERGDAIRKEAELINTLYNNEKARLLSANSESEAFIELQTILESVWNKAPLKTGPKFLRDSRELLMKDVKAQPSMQFKEIPVKYTEIDANIKELVDFLYLIETNSKFLFISEMSLQAVPQQVKKDNVQGNPIGKEMQSKSEQKGLKGYIIVSGLMEKIETKK